MVKPDQAIDRFALEVDLQFLRMIKSFGVTDPIVTWRIKLKFLELGVRAWLWSLGKHHLRATVASLNPSFSANFL
jgi:hypothetical protein